MRHRQRSFSTPTNEKDVVEYRLLAKEGSKPLKSPLERF
jgi:hypothetical protein